ncbi:DUF6193 family natural product biosynthesis protein [Streptomyces sp. NPDC020377]|uniref:DUF6193 family natural product biosynthesis protein n=1 Tax=Streptomyces sp. NPDC020377 TaxID=3365070 RepID=UPI0037B005F9
MPTTKQTRTGPACRRVIAFCAAGRLAGARVVCPCSAVLVCQGDGGGPETGGASKRAARAAPGKYTLGVQAGSIEPLHNGRFTVRRRSPFAVIGEVETAEEAVALVLELLPTGPEPVITASADKHV